MTDKSQDTEYRDVLVKSSNREGDSGWSIVREDGWSFFVPATSPVEPAAGMMARFYGRGIGFTVRGLDLNGVEVFYRSAQQQKEKEAEDAKRREQERRYDFEKNRADMDRRYRALPEVFQRRIDKFRTNNPDFRWEFESYELFCCEQAVEIAKKVKLQDLKAFHKLGWEQQKLIVPNLSDGHSGNTFGCAVSLAGHFLSEPENVVKLYGAMAPLVGSKEYGCVPRT